MKNKGKPGCGPRWGWQRESGQGGGWPAPPWAKFMPFGPPGGGPRGPRMFGQGDLRLLLLALIADKPAHGYDLIRTIEARFNGSYTPSAGTIYPTLTLLEEQELIAPAQDGAQKKTYEATAKGLQFLEENAETIKALMTRIDIMANSANAAPPSPALMAAIQTLRAAVMSKSGATAEEQDRVQSIIEQAARDIMSGK